MLSSLTKKEITNFSHCKKQQATLISWILIWWLVKDCHWKSAL